MEKEAVVIEELFNGGGDTVAVFSYDTINSMVIGKCLEVTMRADAYDRYDVIGELQGGSIKL